MAEKIKSRIQLKNDTSSNWELATNFIPKAGEICIYTDIPSLKVGDGETKINDLPFMGDEAITNEEIQALFDEKIKFYVNGEEFITTYQFWSELIENNPELGFKKSVLDSDNVTYLGRELFKEDENIVSIYDGIIDNHNYSAMGAAEPI